MYIIFSPKPDFHCTVSFLLLLVLVLMLLGRLGFTNSALVFLGPADWNGSLHQLWGQSVHWHLRAWVEDRWCQKPKDSVRLPDSQHQLHCHHLCRHQKEGVWRGVLHLFGKGVLSLKHERQDASKNVVQNWELTTDNQNYSGIHPELMIAIFKRSVQEYS